MNVIPTDLSTIGVMAGLFFIFIALVGGGFVIKELQIPKIPKWMRVLSFFMGIGLIFFFVYGISPNPATYSDDFGDIQIIYTDKEPDTTDHNITFLQLTATSYHNPPRINDRIILEFTLRNDGDNPVKFSGTFVAARDPFRQNKDFGNSNEDKIIQPMDTVKTKANIIVDKKGIWEFGPCYALDIPEVIEEDNLCPTEWRRFQVVVQ